MSLPTKLAKQAKRYLTMDDIAKYKFIKEAYGEASFAVIAKAANTYPNKIRRDANRLGIESNDKAEAQSLAISRGTHKHPTKGTHRSIETKVKISEGRAKAWEELTPEERERLSQLGKDQWAQMSDAEKTAFQQAAGDAIREAAKTGSKLEKFLQQELIKAGYRVEFHKERMIKNERLQIDLWLPKMGVAIEVDGPSHFSPIWGHKALARNQRADSEKTGLLIGAGVVLLRVRQKKTLSQKFKRDILQEVIQTLEEIDRQFPPHNKRHITLGD